MTLHHLTESENRLFRSNNPYPRPGRLWEAWNNGCLVCHRPFDTLISSCDNSQGSVYGFHNGKCYQRHLLEYNIECCQWRDAIQATPIERIQERLTYAMHYLRDATRTIREYEEITTLYHRARGRAERSQPWPPR